MSYLYRSYLKRRAIRIHEQFEKYEEICRQIAQEYINHEADELALAFGTIAETIHLANKLLSDTIEYM